MPALRVKRLEKIRGWKWDNKDDAATWDKIFRSLKQHAKETGTTRAPYQDAQLKSWAPKQRSKFGQGELTTKQITQLESLNDWKWKPKEDRWAESFKVLEKFVRQKGHLKITTGLIGPHGDLGTWLEGQRGQFKRNPEKFNKSHRDMFEALPGWTWQPHDHSFETNYLEMLKFAKKHGHCRIPEENKTLKGWANKQRTKWTKSANPDKDEQLMRLTGLSGWTWDPKTSSWDQSYSDLVKYVKTHGKCTVTKLENPKLYAWMHHQRKKYSRGTPPLTQSQKILLQSLSGWEWSNSK